MADSSTEETTYVSYYLKDLEEIPKNRQFAFKESKDGRYTLVNHLEESKPDDWEMVDGEEVGGTKDDGFVYRSVLYSKETKKPLSMAPPRSISFDDFVATPHLTKDMVYINEIVEGTMINMFFDADLQEWVLSTKGRVGGDYFFFRTDYSSHHFPMQGKTQYTFYEMFVEALGGDYRDNLNELECIRHLPIVCCYSFVLQHPMNHLVVPIVTPCVYLVQVYELIQNIALLHPISSVRFWDCFLNTAICFPNTFEIDPTIDDIYVKMEEIRQEYTLSPPSIYAKDPYFMGLMIHNMKNGDRCSIRCPGYELLKSIRGNHPNLLYHFLELQKEHKTFLFLQHFPRYTPLFTHFNRLFWDFVIELHRAYVSYYVQKTGQRVPKKYFPLVYRLHHEIYLPSLNTISDTGEISRRIIHQNQVQNYVFQMNPKQLYYYMNYVEPVNE